MSFARHRPRSACLAYRVRGDSGRPRRPSLWAAPRDKRRQREQPLAPLEAPISGSEGERKTAGQDPLGVQRETQGGHPFENGEHGHCENPCEDPPADEFGDVFGDPEPSATKGSAGQRSRCSGKAWWLPPTAAALWGPSHCRAFSGPPAFSAARDSFRGASPFYEGPAPAGPPTAGHRRLHRRF